MSSDLQTCLEPAYRRQKIGRTMKAAGQGLLIGASLALGLGLARIVADFAFGGMAVVASVVTLSALAGALRGYLWSGSWGGAAAAVDQRFGLKDRAGTALRFERNGDARADAWSQLQIEDAREHLAVVDGRQAVSLRMPRTLPWGLGVLALAVVLVLWPLDDATVQAGPSEAMPEVLAEVEALREEIEEIQELAEDEESEELKELVEELEEKLEEMEEPGVDLKEALATISEMQSMIAAEMAEYDFALIDTNLNSLGEAMQTSTSLDNAGKALQDGEFEKAAMEFEKLDAAALEKRKNEKALEELKKVKAAMAKAGLGKLGELTGELVDAIESGTESECKGIGEGLAKYLSKHAKKKKIGECLACKSLCMGECKNSLAANCRAKGHKPSKSDRPSNQWGLTTSGNIDGERTGIKANRKREEITGKAGVGPSEMETTSSPDGTETARRGYKEKYKKYKKLSEAVLEGENIPLGQRQTIRRYFELIRPRNDAASPVETGK